MKFHGIVVAGAAWAAVWVAANAGKPFHVDDPLFLDWARHLAPLKGETRTGTINWSGVSEPIENQTRHYPPGWAWMIAGIRRVPGSSEGLLHWMQLPFLVAAVAGCARLARAWGASSGWTALLCATSPLVLLPATTVMPDLACFGPAVLGLALWTEARGWRGLVTAGLLVLFSAQMKQTVLPLLPLLFVSPGGSYVRDPRRLGVAVAAVALAGWYPPGSGGGSGWLGGHLAWIVGWAWEPGLAFPRIGYALAVCAGVVLSPLGFAAAIAAGRGPGPAARVRAVWRAVLVLLVLIAAGMWGESARATGAVGPVATGASAVWFAAAIVVFLAWCQLGAGSRRRPRSCWPVWWVALASAGYFAGAPFPAARFLIFLLPPLAAWFATDVTHRFGRRAAAVLLVAVAGGNLALSVSLARADFAFARFVRHAATEGAREARERGLPLVTTGHWGLQWYVERAGGRELDRAVDRLPTGCVVLEPAVTDHLALPERFDRRRRREKVLDGPTPAVFLPAVCFSGPDAAAWHGGDAWLPYSLGRGPVERVRILEVIPEGARP
jgi:hypothetical protein